MPDNTINELTEVAAEKLKISQRDDSAANEIKDLENLSNDAQAKPQLSLTKIICDPTLVKLEQKVTQGKTQPRKSKKRDRGSLNQYSYDTVG